MCICVQTCVHIHTHMYFDKSFIEIQSTYHKIHPDIYIWPDIFLALNWNSESRLMKSWFFVQLWKGRFFLWVTVPWARVPGLAGAAQWDFSPCLLPQPAPLCLGTTYAANCGGPFISPSNPRLPQCTLLKVHYHALHQVGVCDNELGTWANGKAHCLSKLLHGHKSYILGLLFILSCVCGWVLQSFSSLECCPATAVFWAPVLGWKQSWNAPCLWTTWFPVIRAVELHTHWALSVYVQLYQGWWGNGFQTWEPIRLWEFSPGIVKCGKWGQCGEFFINQCIQFEDLAILFWDYISPTFILSHSVFFNEMVLIMDHRFFFFCWPD